MSYAYIKPIDPPGQLAFVEIITIGPVEGVPPRPSPGPNPPNGGPVDPGYSPPWAQIPPGGGGPVDPGYGIPEGGLPGWSKAAIGPPGKNVPPADPPLAANYEWAMVVYADKTVSWAQIGPHVQPL